MLWCHLSEMGLVTTFCNVPLHSFNYCISHMLGFLSYHVVIVRPGKWWLCDVTVRDRAQD